MTIRKILARGLLPSLLAVSLMGAYSGVAMAEDPGESDEYVFDGYTLTVALISEDMEFTWDDENVCYPAIGSATDCTVTLKMDGKEYLGNVKHSVSAIPRIDRTQYLAKADRTKELDVPDLSDLGFDAVPSSTDTRYVVFELDKKPTTGTISVNMNSISAFTDGFSTDYTYEFYSSSKTPSATWTFSTDDLVENPPLDLWEYYNAKPAETDALIPEEENTNPRDFILYTNVTSGKCGLNSLQLVDVPVGHDSSPGVYFIKRDKYGASDVTDVTMQLSGSDSTQSMQPHLGTVYFTSPTKWDADLGRYTRTSNWNMSLLGITSKKDTHGFTVEDFPIEVTDEGLSANLYSLNINTMHKEWFDELEDDGVDPSNNVVDTPIKLEPMIDAADTYDSTLTLNVDSKLSKYNTALLNSIPEMRIRGEATQAYLDNNVRSDASLGDIVTWGTVDAISSGKTSVSVDAGSYSIDASDSISVKVSGNATVKSGKTKEIKAVVEPRYSLKVTSEAGVVNCTIDGTDYNGDASLLFATEGNIAYTIKDKDSGKTYSVVMTDADPHKELVLGSAGAEDVGLVDEFEDVPNTADPITTVMIIVSVLAVLFAGSFVLVYRANKKNERG